MQQAKKCIIVTLTVNILAVVFLVITIPAAASELNYQEIFSDDFSVDSTTSYEWEEFGYTNPNWPRAFYYYKHENQYVDITTADNIGLTVKHDLSGIIQSGRIEFDFLPYRTFPSDGTVTLSAYAANGDFYEFYYTHDAYKGSLYRTKMIKVANGTPVINEIFIPNPNGYTLNEWHTVSLDFTPAGMSGAIDGVEIRNETDLAQNVIDISRFEIKFGQQNQYLDNIRVYESFSAVEALVTINPETLNLSSKGKYVTCYIELPEGQANIIDISTVKLNDTIVAEAKPATNYDTDQDETTGMMVKFDRKLVIDLILESGLTDLAQLTVTGTLNDGIAFMGSDTIRIIE